MKVRASETCMKDAQAEIIMIMIRQNARFRSSWEPGGDLIILTVRVAGVTVTVVNGVIGHCRQAFGKILK